MSTDAHTHKWIYYIPDSLANDSSSLRVSRRCACGKREKGRFLRVGKWDKVWESYEESEVTG